MSFENDTTKKKTKKQNICAFDLSDPQARTGKMMEKGRRRDEVVGNNDQTFVARVSGLLTLVFFDLSGVMPLT